MRRNRLCNSTCDILTVQTLGCRSEWCTQVREQAGCTHLPQSDSEAQAYLLYCWFAYGLPSQIPILTFAHFISKPSQSASAAAHVALNFAIRFACIQISQSTLWSINQLFDQSVNSLCWLRSVGHPKAVTHHMTAWRTRIPNQIV